MIRKNATYNNVYLYIIECDSLDSFNLNTSVIKSTDYIYSFIWNNKYHVFVHSKYDIENSKTIPVMTLTFIDWYTLVTVNPDDYVYIRDVLCGNLLDIDINLNYIMFLARQSIRNVSKYASVDMTSHICEKLRKVYTLNQL